MIFLRNNRYQGNGNHSAPLNLLLLFASIAVLAGGVYFGARIFHRTAGETQTAELKETEDISSGESEDVLAAEGGTGTAAASNPARLDVSDVVKIAMPSVVSITNKSVQEVEYMFRGTLEVESESSGSGIIIAQTDTELLIATNYHVVEDADTLTVCFSVNSEDEADAIVGAVVKGSDDQYDLAVVAVTASDVPENVLKQISVAEFGSSENLRVGDPAIAIGNALGYGQSVTRGIISALDRTIEIDGVPKEYIQTDAAINFGNSGGALLNEDGKVIGINSAKAASSGVEGMGYAIPIDEAEPILAELMDRETREILDEPDRGFLGVYTEDISSEARSLYDIPSGAYISMVLSDSPAERAGLQKGDIICRLDGISVTSSDRFLELMQYYGRGETVEIELLRSNMGNYETKEVEVTFDGQPEQDDPEPEQEEQNDQYRGFPFGGRNRSPF